MQVKHPRPLTPHTPVVLIMIAFSFLVCVRAPRVRPLACVRFMRVKPAITDAPPGTPRAAVFIMFAAATVAGASTLRTAAGVASTGRLGCVGVLASRVATGLGRTKGEPE